MEDYFKWVIDEETGFRKLKFIYKIEFEKEIDKFKDYVGEMKICSKCRKELPTSTYFFCSGGKNKKLHYYCKKCEDHVYGWGRNENYKLNDLGFHYCSKCDRILPLNNFYFHQTNGKCNRTGFASNCKECMGSSFGLNEYINEYKELLLVNNGFKICQQCLLELPDTDDYFFKKKDRQNGDCICKKCKGFEYGVFRPNMVLKDIIPSGFKFCLTCGNLIEIKNMLPNNSMCKACAKKRNRIYNQKPEVKLSKSKHRHNRYAKQSSLKNDLTNNDWVETLMFFNNICAYCGMTEEEHIKLFGESLHKDHVIPLSKGGEYTKGNIIPACRTCNCSKNKKSLEKFFEYKSNFTEENLNKILEFLSINNIDIV